MDDPASSSADTGSRALVAGGSGLIGSRLLELRRVHPAAMTAALFRLIPSSLEQFCIPIVADQAGGWSSGLLTRSVADFKPEVFVCCLGTTLRRAGGREEFERVDRHLCRQLAAAARAQGAQRAVLVSSLGADRHASGFYLRVKGRVEQDFIDVGFERLDILRPSLLLGARQEVRLLEGLSQRLAGVTRPLWRGPLRRYRPIPAQQVARSIVRLIECREPGMFVHENPVLLGMH